MTELGPAPTTKPKAFWDFLVRWQDWSSWLPLCIALALFAFAVLPGFDKDAGKDTLPILAVLPIKIAYAIAACGVVFLVRRRWRRKLTAEEQRQLWEGLTDSRFDKTWADRIGPLAVYFGDLVFTLCALFMLLRFFSLPA